MLPKLLPIPEPGASLRHTAVASMKPTGMMVTLPIWICSGELVAAPCGGSCTGYLGLGATGDKSGRAPVALATAPPARVKPDACAAGWVAACSAGLAGGVGNPSISL